MKSEAQKKALRKYDAVHYGTISSKLKLQDIAVYKKYTAKHNITMGKLISRCINYCINNNVDISEEIKLNSDTTDKE